MGLQLENEYVRKGMIVSHLLNLKRMAVEIGFDVPIYSMTHWMDSEYPKGEIVPYAGFILKLLGRLPEKKRSLHPILNILLITDFQIT